MKATLEVINPMQGDGVIGKYAIGGAVGATFYLEPAATLDIDIFVSLTISSDGLPITAPIYDYLAERGSRVEGEAILIAGWPVQFLPPGNGLGEEALAQAVSAEVEGVRTWAMTAEHLDAIARQTARKRPHPCSSVRRKRRAGSRQT